MEQNKEEIVQEELKPNPEYILEVKNLKKYFPLNRNFLVSLKLIYVLLIMYHLA